MKRLFCVIYKIHGDTSKYDLDYIGNGLYKMYLGGNKRSTYDSILKVVKSMKFDGCKITEVVDIIETK